MEATLPNPLEGTGESLCKAGSITVRFGVVSAQRYVVEAIRDVDLVGIYGSVRWVGMLYAVKQAT